MPIPPIPPTWYQYQWPTEDIANPSQADYSSPKVSILIEWFACFLKESTGDSIYDAHTMEFKYANGIVVGYAGGTPNQYLDAWRAAHQPKSAEQIHYEDVAEQSHRLYEFMINSPANITYFQDPPNGTC